MNDHNCRNCGAPVAPGTVCEYCGTLRMEEVRRAIEISSDRITLVCDKIGKLPPKDEIFYWAGDKIVWHEVL